MGLSSARLVSRRCGVQRIGIPLLCFLSPPQPPHQPNMPHAPRVAILGLCLFVLSKVSAYPNPQPQAGLKLDSSQPAFGFVTGSPSTQAASATTITQLPLATLPTRYSSSLLTSESSTLIAAAAATFQPSSILSFSSFSVADVVPASRSSLDPTIAITPTLDLPDFSPGPNASPAPIGTPPPALQPSGQVPLSPPPDHQTASSLIELPQSSDAASVLSQEHSATPVNNNFVIGMVFASMFAFMIVCLLILQCSRWYRTKRTSLSSPNLARSGSFSNSAAMEKRKWMRGTLFDVETGMVENLAGIGRAARELLPLRGGFSALIGPLGLAMESKKRGYKGDRRITALHMRSPSFKSTTLNPFEPPKAITAPADEPTMKEHEPSTPSPLAGT